jgi:hypothetical protein
MQQRIISIGLDSSSKLDGCLSIGSNQQLGKAGRIHPPERGDIARREPQGFIDVGLGIGSATHVVFRNAQHLVSVSQVGIQRQGSLTLSRTVGYAIGADEDNGQGEMSPGMVRRKA